MKGWDRDGRELELSERQAAEVRALLADPGRGERYDEDWATVLHTAVRYDRIRRGESEAASERA